MDIYKNKIDFWEPSKVYFFTYEVLGIKIVGI